MDKVDKETRSKMMSGIRGKNTRPEIIIRKKLHAKGFRYRICDKSVFGKPDLVLRKYNAVIFIHGCFWHGHDCHLFKVPSTNTDFWVDKINTNKERDKKVIDQLKKKNWRICIIWECAIKGKKQLEQIDSKIDQISTWLKSDSGWFETSESS